MNLFTTGQLFRYFIVDLDIFFRRIRRLRFSSISTSSLINLSSFSRRFFRRFQLRNFSSLSMLFFISFDVVVFRRHFFRHFRRRRFFRPRPENTSFFVAFEVVFPTLTTSSFFRRRFSSLLKSSFLRRFHFSYLSTSSFFPRFQRFFFVPACPRCFFFRIGSDDWMCRMRGCSLGCSALMAYCSRFGGRCWCSDVSYARV